MEYLVVKDIPKSELKNSYKAYVNYLFKNENGVYNICRTEEDVMKSNQWFKNLPLKAIIVSKEPINVGDKFISTLAKSEELFGKIFTLIDVNEKGVGLITIMDELGNELISTTYLISDAYKYVRKANMADKEKLVNGIITPLETI